MMKSVELFKTLSQDIIDDITKNLTLQLYWPDDEIMKAGTTGNHIYFLACGTVAIYTLSGQEVCQLYDGAYFGEIACVTDERQETSCCCRCRRDL